MKKVSHHDRQKLRNLYVYLDKFDNDSVNKNIQRQIDEIKAKYPDVFDNEK
nr:hypothetical protein [uncultured Allomuricauda sp.]|tara:strand:- start:2749 stop:2901 length:153 start_codon:yes stop_codon:yes gene_type:complete